nr:hypothetical protein Iba_chr02cCG10650 [Ipomoea batatas]GMC64637.1 hypothetical protein Iba_chr02dCG6780 [Ipomoea batatas]
MNLLATVCGFMILSQLLNSPLLKIRWKYSPINTESAMAKKYGRLSTPADATLATEEFVVSPNPNGNSGS